MELKGAENVTFSRRGPGPSYVRREGMSCPPSWRGQDCMKSVVFFSSAEARDKYGWRRKDFIGEAKEKGVNGRGGGLQWGRRGLHGKSGQSRGVRGDTCRATASVPAEFLLSLD